MRIVIATRSMNDELYARASAFWPAHIERKRITGYNDWTHALAYLHALLNTDADYVVNCDEDCFVFRWEVVDTLISYMHGHGIHYAGMPDTAGNCHHRNNGSFVHNPFFNVFRPKVLQRALLACPWYAHAVAINSNPDGCAHHEVFNNFFAALSELHQPLDLRGKDHPDGTSTILKWQYTEFALHSWYSRAYGTPGPQQDRIDAVYREAYDRFNLVPL